MRFVKGLVALVLILAISIAVGVVFYGVTQHAGLSEIKTRIGALSGQSRKAVRQEPLLERGKAVAERVAHALSPRSSSADADTSASSTDDVRVYFGPCQPWNPLGIEHAFIAFLRSAKESIRGAFYELELPDAAQTLIEQHQAGINVRIVSDSDYRTREAIQSCIRAGIPVVFDDRGALMHDKFCVVDHRYVWTGSTNATENCMYRNNNNSLLITSDQLATDYTAEFDEMFTSHEFGKRSPRNTPFPEVTVGDTRIECYFAPEDHAQRAIVAAIDKAQATIDFMAFTFTSRDIAEAMANRIKQGVKVRGLFDSRLAAIKGSQDEYLAQHGARVYMDQNGYAMHDKIIVIDGKTVITGSYNFTKSAETQNDENVLILHSPKIGAAYDREFESLLPK